MRRLFERRSRRARQTMSRLGYEAALAAVARERGVDPSEMQVTPGRRPSSQVTRIRLEALYLAVTAYDLSFRQAAQAAGVDVAVVSRAVRRVVDERDDPKIDSRFDHLTEHLRAAA